MKKLFTVFLIVVLFISVGVLAFEKNEFELGYDDTEIYTVKSGDSLWNFINEIENRDDYDGYYLVDIIRDINGLDSDILRVGQKIEVPTKVYDIKS